MFLCLLFLRRGCYLAAIGLRWQSGLVGIIQFVLYLLLFKEVFQRKDKEMDTPNNTSLIISSSMVVGGWYLKSSMNDHLIGPLGEVLEVSVLMFQKCTHLQLWALFCSGCLENGVHKVLNCWTFWALCWRIVLPPQKALLVNTGPYCVALTASTFLLPTESINDWHGHCTSVFHYFGPAN